MASVEDILALAGSLPEMKEAQIQADFGSVRDAWNAKKTISLPDAGLKEAVTRIVARDQAAGFRGEVMASQEGGVLQFNTTSDSRFRGHRIARSRGGYVLYGHESMYGYLAGLPGGAPAPVPPPARGPSRTPTPAKGVPAAAPSARGPARATPPPKGGSPATSPARVAANPSEARHPVTGGSEASLGQGRSSTLRRVAPLIGVLLLVGLLYGGCRIRRSRREVAEAAEAEKVLSQFIAQIKAGRYDEAYRLCSNSTGSGIGPFWSGSDLLRFWTTNVKGEPQCARYVRSEEMMSVDFRTKEQASFDAIVFDVQMEAVPGGLPSVEISLEKKPDGRWMIYRIGAFCDKCGGEFGRHSPGCPRK